MLALNKRFGRLLSSPVLSSINIVVVQTLPVSCGVPFTSPTPIVSNYLTLDYQQQYQQLLSTYVANYNFQWILMRLRLERVVHSMLTSRVIFHIRAQAGDTIDLSDGTTALSWWWVFQQVEPHSRPTTKRIIPIGFLGVLLLFQDKTNYRSAFWDLGWL